MIAHRRGGSVGGRGFGGGGVSQRSLMLCTNARSAGDMLSSCIFAVAQAQVPISSPTQAAFFFPMVSS